MVVVVLATGIVVSSGTLLLVLVGRQGSTSERGVESLGNDERTNIKL